MTTENKDIDNHFGLILGQIRKGRSLSELSEALRDLVQAVRDTGKKGKLVYTVAVEPAAKTDGRVLMVSDDVALKAPESARDASLFFSTDEGRLSRKDPDQEEFPFDKLAGKEEAREDGDEEARG